MDGDNRVAENLAWCARSLEELDRTLTNRLEELTCSTECVVAEELYQAHILGALVSIIRTPADVHQLTEPDIQDRLVETAYQLARRMTLRNIRARGTTGVEKNGTDS